MSRTRVRVSTVRGSGWVSLRFIFIQERTCNGSPLPPPSEMVRPSALQKGLTPSATTDGTDSGLPD
jgi:hypothetical protein